ncbi:unnamed protein product [Effrenium voratum]|nr:unnamed protein product [Effrenium voratum]
MASPSGCSETLLPPEDCFNPKQPISDHLPQVFRLAGHEILTWNIMARGKSGMKGRSGTVLEGKVLTNNGLSCDETPEAYAQRLRSRVWPVVCRWLGGGMRMACLQEFPTQPLLQKELLGQLQATRPSLQLAVGSAWEANFTQLLGHCTAVVWDSSLWREIPCQVPTAHALRLQLGTTAIASVHLPFVDSPGGPRYGDGLKRALHFVQNLAKTAGQLTAAGDFNVNVEDLKAKAEGLAEIAMVPDSAMFKSQRITVDACVKFDSSSTPSGLEASQMVCHEGVWRLSSAEIFGKDGRDAFVSKHVAQSLHDDPRLWRLSDTAVFSLGCWPFTDQLREVGRLLRDAMPQRASKKQKLGNPLLGMSAYASDSNDSSDASPCDDAAQKQSARIRQVRQWPLPKA